MRICRIILRRKSLTGCRGRSSFISSSYGKMNEIDYEKYKSRLDELYPILSEEEKREILEMRYEFWENIMPYVFEVK